MDDDYPLTFWTALANLLLMPWLFLVAAVCKLMGRP